MGLIKFKIQKPLPYIKLNVRDVEYNAIGGDGDEPMDFTANADEEEGGEGAESKEKTEDPNKTEETLHA